MSGSRPCRRGYDLSTTSTAATLDPRRRWSSATVDSATPAAAKHSWVSGARRPSTALAAARRQRAPTAALAGTDAGGDVGPRWRVGVRARHHPPRVGVAIQRRHRPRGFGWSTAGGYRPDLRRGGSGAVRGERATRRDPLADGLSRGAARDPLGVPDESPLDAVARDAGLEQGGGNPPGRRRRRPGEAEAVVGERRRACGRSRSTRPRPTSCRRYGSAPANSPRPSVPVGVLRLRDGVVLRPTHPRWRAGPGRAGATVHHKPSVAGPRDHSTDRDPVAGTPGRARLDLSPRRGDREVVRRRPGQRLVMDIPRVRHFVDTPAHVELVESLGDRHAWLDDSPGATRTCGWC